MTSPRQYKALFDKADKAGKAAAEACTPTPMVVGTAKGLFSNDIDYSQPTYFVAGGPCGFAWVKFAGNTGFGRWAKKAGLATKAYGGGLQVRASVGGQSMQIKEAYAYAFAATLREGGVTAYAESRMD